MAIHRLNHAVLYVRNVERSLAFYRDVLDFSPIMGTDELRGAASLRAPGSTNDHDLGLFEIGDEAASSPAGHSSVGLYHLAWEVDTLRDLAELTAKLADAGALSGSSDHSTTKSLYGHDPDGLQFEIAWLVPAEYLDQVAMTARFRVQPLDLDAEIQRYGPDTPGGVGISRMSSPATG